MSIKSKTALIPIPNICITSSDHGNSAIIRLLVLSYLSVSFSQTNSLVIFMLKSEIKQNLKVIFILKCCHWIIKITTNTENRTFTILYKLQMFVPYKRIYQGSRRCPRLAPITTKEKNSDLLEERPCGLIERYDMLMGRTQSQHLISYFCLFLV